MSFNAEKVAKLKEWFEANYLDGDKIQKGQMMASSECFDAVTQAYKEGEDNKREELLTLARDIETVEKLAYKSGRESMREEATKVALIKGDPRFYDKGGYVNFAQSSIAEAIRKIEV